MSNGETGKMDRYSRLSPFSQSDQMEIAIYSLNFFSPANHTENCKIIGIAPNSGKITPFDGSDFLKYLKNINILNDVERYRNPIRNILSRLEHFGLLTLCGQGPDITLGRKYYFLKELTNLEQKGVLWLSEALGPQFISSQYQNITVQITGISNDGDIHAGTGLVISPNWVLTCEHVLSGMKVDEEQKFGASTCAVRRILTHEKIDVGLIQFESEKIDTLPSLAFRDPGLAEVLYTFGYPRVPLARNAPLIMQRGEVTTPEVQLFDGSEVFLFSAIARPGNSGGPIISSSGHVIGIVTQELSETNTRISPFHAGIRSSTIKQAIYEIEPSIELPFENYE